MKKLQFISLFLLCLMLFSSCDGIGDGALVAGVGRAPAIEKDSIETGAGIETEQALLKGVLVKSSSIAQLGEIADCKIILYKKGNVDSKVDLIGNDAEEIYSVFINSKFESSGENNGFSYKDCIEVTFVDINGGKEIFKVAVTDKFHKDSGYFGKISGLYEFLKGYLV